MMSNKLIQAVIIEDEPKNVTLLKKLLEMYCPNVKVAGNANSIKGSVTLIKETNPDLVFLDIEIGGGNAFELLDILQPVKFEIIFVTAYDNYLLKAIRYSALDYLFKPINITELITAVNKSINKIRNQNISKKVESLLENFLIQKTSTTITIPTAFGFHIIAVQNILRCEAKGSYTNIYLNDGKNYTASKSLKEYEEILPSDLFFRTHHSHLVNMNFVIRYNKGKGGTIEMKDKSTIPLAARRKNDFLRLFYPMNHTY
jgi:two-component system LytT family response regulator